MHLLENLIGNENLLTPIKGSMLSVRTQNALHSYGFRIYAQLLFANYHELKRVPGLGDGSIEDIDSTLSPLDFTYGMFSDTKTAQEQSAKLAIVGQTIQDIHKITMEQAIKATKEHLMTTSLNQEVNIAIPEEYLAAMRENHIIPGDLSSEFEEAILHVIKIRLAKEIGPWGMANLDLDKT